MTDQNPDLGNDEDMPSDLEMLGCDAAILAGLLEALEVLDHRACGPDCGLARQARKSMGPLLIVASQKAWELAHALDDLGAPKETMQ